MESSPNFGKPLTWKYMDEQLASYRAGYLVPYCIALDIYLHTFRGCWKKKLGS